MEEIQKLKYDNILPDVAIHLFAEYKDRGKAANIFVIQTKFKLGFFRSKRLIDFMVENGILELTSPDVRFRWKFIQESLPVLIAKIEELREKRQPALLDNDWQ